MNYSFKRIDGFWYICTDTHRFKTKLTFDEELLYDITKKRMIEKHERNLTLNDFLYNQLLHTTKVLFKHISDDVIESKLEVFKEMLPYEMEEI